MSSPAGPLCLGLIFNRFHDKIEGQVQRFPTHPLPSHIHSLPYYRHPHQRVHLSQPMSQHGHIIITQSPQFTRVLSWWCPVCRFGQKHKGRYPPLSHRIVPRVRGPLSFVCPFLLYSWRPATTGHFPVSIAFSFLQCHRAGIVYVAFSTWLLLLSSDWFKTAERDQFLSVSRELKSVTTTTFVEDSDNHQVCVYVDCDVGIPLSLCEMICVSIEGGERPLGPTGGVLGSKYYYRDNLPCFPWTAYIRSSSYKVEFSQKLAKADTMFIFRRNNKQ